MQDRRMSPDFIRNLASQLSGGAQGGGMPQGGPPPQQGGQSQIAQLLANAPNAMQSLAQRAGPQGGISLPWQVPQDMPVPVRGGMPQLMQQGPGPAQGMPQGGQMPQGGLPGGGFIPPQIQAALAARAQGGGGMPQGMPQGPAAAMQGFNQALAQRGAPPPQGGQMPPNQYGSMNMRPGPAAPPPGAQQQAAAAGFNQALAQRQAQAGAQQQASQAQANQQRFNQARAQTPPIRDEREDRY